MVTKSSCRPEIMAAWSVPVMLEVLGVSAALAGLWAAVMSPPRPCVVAPSWPAHLPDSWRSAAGASGRVVDEVAIDDVAKRVASSSRGHEAARKKTAGRPLRKHRSIRQSAAHERSYFSQRCRKANACE
jgi:hypothetical protein